jgi:hypothetical protein
LKLGTNGVLSRAYHPRTHDVSRRLKITNCWMRGQKTEPAARPTVGDRRIRAAG